MESTGSPGTPPPEEAPVPQEAPPPAEFAPPPPQPVEPAPAAGSAIYFIYTWTNMRGSPGQRVLGLETLNAADGAVLTQPQAIKRWLYLFGPFVLAETASIMLGGLGAIVGLLVFAYAIYLLYTAANSPTRQGFHDVQATTVVVKVKR
jgi:uncharacterized RDD family membrane protein YckC